ncbi:hypothetical protein CHISP_0570 [Chitinispirillum alkaliphilum]|nr:hypothetical protein CHISP_0570 [Chitinispirillum alkaliphilum]
MTKEDSIIIHDTKRYDYVDLEIYEVKSKKILSTDSVNYTTRIIYGYNGEKWLVKVPVFTFETGCFEEMELCQNMNSWLYSKSKMQLTRLT